MCIERNVLISEDMANEMLPGTSDQGEVKDDETKKCILKIADVCLKQRSFLLACKKYIQAGEKLKAIKALLQSGDTEKIIFFASKINLLQFL